MRNSTSPALIGVLASTGTSTTSPATLGTIATELRSTTAEPCGAPQPIGMNRPNNSRTSTIAGETFQNSIERHDPQLHQPEQEHEVDVEDRDDHCRSSARAGQST